jgi:hypothetical protein
LVLKGEEERARLASLKPLVLAFQGAVFRPHARGNVANAFRPSWHPSINALHITEGGLAKKSTTQTSKQGTKPVSWTLMIFMGASADVPGVADLTPQAEKSLKQMKEVVASFDSNSDENRYVNTFVQVHGKDNPVRYHLEKDVETPVPQSEQESANGSALTHFIEWAITAAPHSDKIDHRRMLVIWGHAYEFTIDPVETPTGVDSIDFAEVTQIFTDLQARLKEKYPTTDKKLDIVGFDSCDLATIEMSWQLHEFAHYSLASQIDEPLPGWPYGDILKGVKEAAVLRPMTPSDLGIFIVRQYCGKYEKQAVSLTLLDLDRAGDVFKATQQLAVSLVEATEDPDEIDLAIHLFFRSQIWEGRPFVDVADLCLNLWRYSSNPQVVGAAARLGDLLVRTSKQGVVKVQPFVLEHGRNAHQTARLTGVNLYAPFVAPHFDWPQASAQYLKFVFARDTYWGRYVETLAQAT